MRYHKAGRLRFLAHLEVVHAIERGARRADLPYAVTRGFSPHMKVSFGPALPVATTGLNEYVDLWLSAYVPAEEVRVRFAAAMPDGLAPLEARYVPDALPSLSAACTVAVYEIAIGERSIEHEELDEALGAVVRSGELSVQHKGKTKVFDLTRSLPKEPRVRSTEIGDSRRRDDADGPARLTPTRDAADRGTLPDRRARRLDGSDACRHPGRRGRGDEASYLTGESADGGRATTRDAYLA